MKALDGSVGGSQPAIKPARQRVNTVALCFGFIVKLGGTICVVFWKGCAAAPTLWIYFADLVGPFGLTTPQAQGGTAGTGGPLAATGATNISQPPTWYNPPNPQGGEHRGQNFPGGRRKGE
jgi:hypothetical protein